MNAFKSFAATGLVLAALCGSRAAAAQPAPITVLQGVRLVGGPSGSPIGSANILLQGDRIVAAGPATATPVPAGAKVVDLRGKTVMPGLITDHAHVGLTDGLSQGDGNYTRSNILRQLRQYQAYGVTTVTSLGINAALFYPLRAELRAGKAQGADLFGADRGVGSPDGAPPQALIKAGAEQLDRPSTPQEARQNVREQKARGADLIKIWVDDFNHRVAAKMTPSIWRAVIDEAHKNGLRVAAHVYYLADAKALVEDGIDILAHGVRDVPVDAAFIKALKAHGTWYIPTLGLDEASYIYAERPAWMSDPFFLRAVQPALRAQLDDPAWAAKKNADPASAISKHNLEINLKNLKTLYDAGVHIGFGADSGANPLRIPGFAEHRELTLMVRAGLTPAQAITVATRNAATLLKLTDRGVIAPGKLADLIVLDADPTEDIANADRISAIWQHGQVVGGPVTSFTP